MSQDFSKGKIYKITNDYNDDVYVGSTCDLLTKRFSGHKKSLTNDKQKNRPLYVLMNDIGFERFRIELVEEYPCQDKYQLRQREGHWIREIGTLNKLIAGRTVKEYKEDNKEKIQEKNKEYREQNKDKIKQYREENKDKIKEYYEDNKEKIQQYYKKQITCDCGCIVVKSQLLRHKKSNKHINLMKTIQTEAAYQNFS
jgi:group I intron endonuclease